MSTQQLTLNEAVDQAIETLPLFRRIPMKFKMRNRKLRAQVVSDLRVKLYDDPDFEKFGLVQAFGSDEFTADTPFNIDIDNLAKFLELIIKYLPAIIEIFIKLFASILFLIAFSLTTSSVEAQDCLTGTCATRPTKAPVLPVVREVVSTGSTVVRSIVETALPPYPVIQQARSNYIPATRSSNCSNCSVQSSTQYYNSSTVTPSMSGHWGYPGSIDQHLLQGHGINPAGMTREQMLAAHDAAHRSQSTVRTYSRSYQAPVRLGRVFRIFR